MNSAECSTKGSVGGPLSGIESLKEDKGEGRMAENLWTNFFYPGRLLAAQGGVMGDPQGTEALLGWAGQLMADDGHGPLHDATVKTDEGLF
jgi:hypothetical protein